MVIVFTAMHSTWQTSRITQDRLNICSGFSGTLFDGIARHTEEGYDFLSRAKEVGFRQAVREQDDPFGNYGPGPRSRRARVDKGKGK